MEVNNFRLIESFLDFQSEDDFYFLQILKRKKENPKIPSNHNNNKRSIRTYYIPSIDYFKGIEKEVKAICKATNARAYIHPTKRSFKKVGKTAFSVMTSRILGEQYNHIYKAYNTACGGTEGISGNKYWVIDIDSEEQIYKEIFKDIIKLIVPTKNGYHLIVSPFYHAEYLRVYSEYCVNSPDIQKNNPTLLYYSDEVSNIQKV